VSPQTPVRHIDDAERRRRIGRRHAIAPEHRVDGALPATEAMGVLHATEPSTVYLSVAARASGVTPADVDRALYEDRTLVKQLAMRRTLFVFPRDLLPHALGSASARVAETEGRKIRKDLVTDAVTDDPDGWMARAEKEILASLEGGALSAKEIRAAVPLTDVRVDSAPGSRWSAALPLTPRVLTWLGARGSVVRGVNGGHWRTSRPVWCRFGEWVSPPPVAVSADEGYTEIVRRWLRVFGPGTEDDIVWWLGSTKTAARRALAAVDAVPVSLDDGRVGWVLADDLEPEPPVEPWTALLPTLDPTTMGWRFRDFYLDPDLAPLLFDSVGNAGTTAWVDGRVVGCWVQDDDGAVRVVTSVEIDADAERRLAVEAERLTEWLDGVVIANVYKSHQMKHAKLP